MKTPDDAARRRIVNRLRRARGQLDGVVNAIEAEADCRDVLTQLAAVTRALNRAGYAIVTTAMAECLADPKATEEREGLTTEELEKLFLSLA